MNTVQLCKLPRPYHVVYPNYEERMRVIRERALLWCQHPVMGQLALVPVSHH